MDDAPGSAQPAELIALEKKPLWYTVIEFNVRLPV